MESVPPSLHLPILHLVTLTRRTSFKDLLDDIYTFAKDRFFIGEEVTVMTESCEKRAAIIIRVFVSNPNTLPSGQHKKWVLIYPHLKFIIFILIFKSINLLKLYLILHVFSVFVFYLASKFSHLPLYSTTQLKNIHQETITYTTTPINL